MQYLMSPVNRIAFIQDFAAAALHVWHVALIGFTARWTSQGNADVGVRVSELDGENQTLRSHHEAYTAQVGATQLR